jgi:putative phage-type endonuclease
MPPLSEADIALRLEGIGSSDISAIAGVNPYRGPHDVWLRKMGIADDDVNEDSTWLGHELEPVCGRRYEREMGAALKPGPGTQRDAVRPWMVATTDYERADGSRICECKYVGQRVAWSWSLDQADGAPYYVLTQAQWQMHVRGIHRCDVAVIFGGTAEFRIYELEYNETLAKRLIDIADTFYRAHILTRAPPPIDGTEGATKTLLALYPKNRLDMRPAPEGAEQWVAKREAADAELERWGTEHLLASNKLREAIGEADGIVGQWGRVTWKANKNGVRSLRIHKAKENAA